MRDRCLDAARECIIALGWRHTTLTEVARRAGVSRMTIYRSWADMKDLLGDLLTREWAEVGDQHFVMEGDLRAVTVDALVKTVRGMRHNPLYQRILDLDSQLVHPYIFTRRGRVQNHLLEMLVPLLEAGQAQGTIRAASPEVLARALHLATQGFVLSTRIWLDDGTTEDALDAELRHMLDQTLRP